MKRLEKPIFLLFLVTAMLASCNGFRPPPAISPTTLSIVTETLAAIPAATFIDTPSPLLSPSPPTDLSSQPSERMVYYTFVDIAKGVPPEGSVVIMPDAYILAPTRSDLIPGPDTAANLRAILKAVLKDGRNGWISSELEIVAVTFDKGHANVVLQGEYFGVGDVTLIAASMQILMTVFANASVQTATITLNGDTIGNLGVSNSMNARPADYVFQRSEIETYMNGHAYVSP